MVQDARPVIYKNKNCQAMPNCGVAGGARAQHVHALDQLRDHTGKKLRRYWLVLKEIIRDTPCFFLRVFDRLNIGYNALQHATPYTRIGGYAQ
jgi:hypothetical protein